MLERALGILSGGGLSTSAVRSWATQADYVLAADGGANIAFDAGVQLHAVIGDMDSVDARAQALGIVMTPDRDQRFTDCDKLLAFAAAKGCQEVTLACVEGDQLDHVLATLYSCARATLLVRLALRRGMGWLVKPGAPRTAPTLPGRRVSLMPIGRCEGVQLTDVQWPLENAVLDPCGLVSVGNRALSTEVRAAVQTGAALLIVEYPGREMPFW